MWSKLYGTTIWRNAKAAYQTPPGRHYHNFDHVLRLYEIAEDLNFPYDPALDLSILAHDVIYDDQPGKERRSADWLLDHAPSSDHEVWTRAADLVMTTVNHRPEGDFRLAFLDLYDLGDCDRSAINRDLLAAESRDLFGRTKTEFMELNGRFLSDLAAAIEAALPDIENEIWRAEWRTIMVGIHHRITRDAAFDPEPSG